MFLHCNLFYADPSDTAAVSLVPVTRGRAAIEGN